MASDFCIRHAAHIIRHGGIIAYPTDTIYGLGCDPYNADAVAKINTLKQRPLNKQFILLAGQLTQILPLVRLSETHKKTITRNTEPTSWVVDAAPDAPAWLINNSNTLTIRICKQGDVQRLCHALGHPIISTSANPSGKTPADNSLQLHKYFHRQVDKIIISDKKLAGRASKIIRLCDNHVIRQ